MKLRLVRFLMVILAITMCASLYADTATDAQAMIKQRQYDKAVTFLNEAIQKDPSYADLYFYLGQAYYFKNDYASAKEQFQNCLDRKRNYEDAKAYLALTYVALKDYPKAKDILDEGVAKSKTRKGLFQDILGKYYLAQGQFSDADLAFRKAQIEEPNNLAYKRDLADLNFENKVYEVAIQGYKEILAADSTDILTQYRLARALYFQQKFGEAMKSLNTAIALDSSYCGRLPIGRRHLHDSGIGGYECGDEW